MGSPSLESFLIGREPTTYFVKPTNVSLSHPHLISITAILFIINVKNNHLQNQDRTNSISYAKLLIMMQQSTVGYLRLKNCKNIRKNLMFDENCEILLLIDSGCGLFILPKKLTNGIIISSLRS